MANLAQSAVTINEWYYDGARVGSKRKVIDATLVLTGQGGGTNLIAASLFGLTTIDRVEGFRDSNGVAYVATPSYDGTGILILQRAAQALTNGTFKSFVVTGVNSTGGAADITATGAASTDVIEMVIDLTTPAKKTSAQFTPGTDKFTQAQAAGDLSAKSLLITTRTAASVSSPSATPTDLTATVRCVIFGKE